MFKNVSKLSGILFYLLLLGKLMDFDWLQLFRPKPFFSVILGLVILTLSQYKKSWSREDVWVSAKWNLIFSGFLTTLLSILSFIGKSSMTKLTISQLAELLLPLLYASILYLLVSLVYEPKSKTQGSTNSPTASAEPVNLMNTSLQDQVFRDFELTARECHVAAKLLENITNKEIAAQLYISEATVKKHIQNIYQKLQAADRTSFKDIYLAKAEAKAGSSKTDY